MPSKVVAPYSRAHDPGVIGVRGRYKGLPVPYGVADFDAPEEKEEKIAYLHGIVAPLLSELRAAGAENFRLRISYGYDSQCAIGFSQDEIRMIGELQCDVPIDCYEKEEPNPPLRMPVGSVGHEE